ncbi:TfoX/Sxy family protein [Gallibacterium genomosp. 1]|uniref:TfoX N-terminal domain-containing protein n=1 Tax=Gallibacterium genomosp. 1 TaxID=155515 RepID=A0AB36DUF9_9PAST|nr:hypothetical protein [Gallibacterium genomosp. 1]OBW99509.1 hypothetical protein QV04_07985 [Gallibacterium genomosp. 1]OBW99752.1 hypothetical protein QV05_09270 [Gallibacterium genomosp. 1]
MASTESYLYFVLDQLKDLKTITYKKMMREYLLYYQGKVIGGIYDNRLLLKSTPSTTLLTMHIKQDFPYQGAKPMLLIDDKDIENHPFLTKLIQIISKDLEKLPN